MIGSHQAWARCGLATLELVLALPFLVALAAIIVSVARAGIVKSEVTVQARNDAWKKRHGASRGTALFFLPDDVQPDKVDDTVEGQASRAVKVSAVLNGIAPVAKSRHSVMAASWDFHDLPKEPPHLELAVRIATSRELKDAQSLLTTLDQVTQKGAALGTELDRHRKQEQQYKDGINKKTDELRSRLPKIQQDKAQTQMEIQRLEGQNKQIQSEIADLRKQRQTAAAMPNRDARQKALSDIDSQIQDRQNQLNETDKEVSKQNAHLHTLDDTEKLINMAPLKQ
jgi:hypothetical protein